MWGQAARVVLNEPRTWTARCRSQVVQVGVREPRPLDDAGVVDEDVEAPEPLDRRGDQRLRALGRGDVVLVGACAVPPAASISAATVAATEPSAPTPCMEPPRSLTTTLAPALRQKQRVGPTDAASGAGDDRDASFEAVRVHVDSRSAVLLAGVRRLVPRGGGGQRRLEPQQVAERAADHGCRLVAGHAGEQLVHELPAAAEGALGVRVVVAPDDRWTGR